MAHPPFRANQQKNEAKGGGKQSPPPPLPLHFAKTLDYLIKEWQALKHLIKRQTLVLENKINFCM